ncbi:Mu transposase C-terminal domain-containing protein [Lysobacter changpingensis]|uniref:Mu transposase C-terminal domain-containing protein n=1 Tax=Lysobacter changpingensis TaxID=2792784 RepID=UPI001A905301|nr:Mu transposase C-terminal domain-containing protein [Lysobacter changpingensis]
MRLAIANRMHVSLRTVNRRYARYLDDDNPAAQLDGLRGNAPGCRILQVEKEKIIERSIKEVYLKRERGTLAAVHAHAEWLCRSAGLKPPCLRTTRSRIRSLDPLLTARRRFGPHEGDALQAPCARGLVVRRPLEIVQIDHALMDVIVASPSSRLPIGRPWITLAIDVFTRCILGYYISLDDPNQTSVGLCLEHACFPKNAWLKALKQTLDYPMFGKMESVHWDNAKTFRAKAIRTQCERMGIRVNSRPVRRPHFGAYIERYIGTLMGKVHMLPGTTFSNSRRRGDYDSEAQATLTLTELQQWTAQEIAGVYHNTPHRGLNDRTPREVWDEAWRCADGRVRLPPVIADRREFLLGFLPYEYRRVQRDGLHLFGLRYWDAALSPFINSHVRHRVHYHQGDLSCVFLSCNGDFIDIPLSDRTRGPFSMLELKLARKDLRPRRGRAHEDELFFSLEAKRALIDNAAAESKKARKEQARRPMRPDVRAAAASVDYASAVTPLDPTSAEVP